MKEIEHCLGKFKQKEERNVLKYAKGAGLVSLFPSHSNTVKVPEITANEVKSNSSSCLMF